MTIGFFAFGVFGKAGERLVVRQQHDVGVERGDFHSSSLRNNHIRCGGSVLYQEFAADAVRIADEQSYAIGASPRAGRNRDAGRAKRGNRIHRSWRSRCSGKMVDALRPVGSAALVRVAEHIDLRLADLESGKPIGPSPFRRSSSRPRPSIVEAQASVEVRTTMPTCSNDLGLRMAASPCGTPAMATGHAL